MGLLDGFKLNIEEEKIDIGVLISNSSLVNCVDFQPPKFTPRDVVSNDEREKYNTQIESGMGVNLYKNKAGMILETNDMYVFEYLQKIFDKLKNTRMDNRQLAYNYEEAGQITCNFIEAGRIRVESKILINRFDQIGMTHYIVFDIASKQEFNA